MSTQELSLSLWNSLAFNVTSAGAVPPRDSDINCRHILLIIFELLLVVLVGN